MGNRMVRIFLVCMSVVGILFLGNIVLDKIFLFEESPPLIQLVDAPHGKYMKRTSYIPHYSLIRGALTWHNRVIEKYSKEASEFGGAFVLTRKTIYEYRYPLLDDGPPVVKEIILYDRQMPKP